MWIPEVDEMETTGWDRLVDSAVSSSGWITGVGVGTGWPMGKCTSQFWRWMCGGERNWEAGWMLHYTGYARDPSWRAGRMRENLQIFSLHLAPGLWFFSHVHTTQHITTRQHNTLIRDTATWKMWLCRGEHPKRKNPEMKDIGSLALEIRKWMRSLCGFRASVDPDNPTRGAQTDLPERGKAC
ncbi:hypothetical protein QR685DRAFT_582398 [Neurospora intermedia]|uniref:Uncharacterized protein n=1 Tax=Neurospora intermedia TaxID=5142 RepID=A0ABR3CXM3_NEUIN